MDCVAVLEQMIALLRQRDRVTYRTRKRQCQRDEATREDVKHARIAGQRPAVDARGHVLAWTW